MSSVTMTSAKTEKSAWLEVANFYNPYRANVPTREDELPAAFRGEGVDLARGVLTVAGGVEKGERRKNPLSERSERLVVKVFRVSSTFFSI